MGPRVLVTIAAVGGAAVIGAGRAVRAAPPGFVIEPVGSSTQWGQITGVVFEPDGTGWVWEKSGKVWKVAGGTRIGRAGATGPGAPPIIDISEEVGNWRDLGLLGLALDPDFAANGRVYLLYVVDYHHLRNFGTPQYSPTADAYFHDTIGRLTRFTLDGAAGHTEVVAGSRAVLVGETMQTGLPMCFQSHSVGSLVFGADGTLLVSNGDGASYDAVDTGGPQSGSSNTALSDGIIAAKEDVGAFRAQLVDSLSGKVLRIDPQTGDGVAGNPFYDAAAPRAPRSRVWEVGLRNPFRFTRRPGTGSPNPADANPGVLYIGDVGWSRAEELDIARTGGLNFGWPLFEGTRDQQLYPAASCLNRDAPNALYSPGGCGPRWHEFRDLLIQETLAQPSWPNPCDINAEIGAGLLNGARPFVHTRPALDWRAGRAARVPIFAGSTPSDADLGTAACPVTGYAGISGYCSVAGTWFSGAGGDYPASWRNLYFHGDYAGFWIHALAFDAQDRLTEVKDFHSGSTPVVCLAENPADGNLYYVGYSYFGESGVLFRIRYSPEAPPTAAAAADVVYGPSPLVVHFSSAGSGDANGPLMLMEWNFGDGTPVSNEANPTHTYVASEDITGQGTIVARVLSELTPPGPLGPGSHDPEVIRDGVMPMAGSSDRTLQFDTFHNGDQGTADDWIGYVFASPRRFNRLVFQEGTQQSDGGYLTSVRVQVRSGGVWTTVTDAVDEPPYDGLNGVNFETSSYTFATVEGDGIRIAGRAGGIGRYFGVGELRAYAEPVGGGGGGAAPQRHDVTLTVYDSVLQRATAGLSVWTDNTPPSVTITSPVDGTESCLNQPTTIPLEAVVDDAEQGPPPGGVSCRWQAVLHHNSHTHPEPVQEGCSGSAVVENHGAAGDVVYFEFVLEATDTLGLTTRRSASVYPRCCAADFNRSGGVSVQDIFDYLAAYFGGDGRADINGAGGVTVQDIFDFLAAYFSGCP